MLLALISSVTLLTKSLSKKKRMLIYANEANFKSIFFFSVLVQEAAIF